MHHHDSRHRFMFSRFNKKDREILHLMVKSLGGVYLEAEHFDLSCTHVICKTLVRTEKFLGACATGKWILHENYIQDSYSNKEWLNEEKYEWSLEMDHDLTSGCGKETLLSVPKQCRLTYRGLSKGPFVNWKVGLACEKKTFPTYKRLLECGGATVSYVRLTCPATSLMKSSLTHVIVNEELMSANKNHLKFVKDFRDLGVACVREVYIGDYLTSFPKPRIDQYLLPIDYNPPCQPRSDDTSQKRHKSVKRGMSNVENKIKDRHLSNSIRRMSVAKKIDSAPQTPVKDQSQPIKPVVWLSPTKSSALLQTTRNKVQRKKTKLLLRPDPSQQSIVHWLSEGNKDLWSVDVPAVSEKKYRLRSQFKNRDDDVVIVNPNYVQTVLSPVNSELPKEVEQDENIIYANILQTDNALTTSKRYETKQFLKDKKSAYSLSGVERETAYFKNYTLMCNHYIHDTNPAWVKGIRGKMLSAKKCSSHQLHRLESLHSAGDKICTAHGGCFSCQLLQSHLDPKATPCTLDDQTLSPVIYVCDVSKNCETSSRELALCCCSSGAAKRMRHNSGRNVEFSKLLYILDIKSTNEVYKLLHCKVILSACDESLHKMKVSLQNLKKSIQTKHEVIASKNDLNTSFRSVIVNPTETASSHVTTFTSCTQQVTVLPEHKHSSLTCQLANVVKCFEEQKLCNMLSWLPTCSLHQCHDVVQRSANKIDTLAPSTVISTILDAVMEDDDGWFPFRVLSAVQAIAASCCYLPATVLSQIMRNILWTSSDERQANIAYTMLSDILELYPPTTAALQKLYLESLSDYKLKEYEINREWNFISDVINGVLMVNGYNIQHQYSSFLLLKYIVAMLQKNFNKYCSSHMKHGIPLIAHIIWPKGYRETNSACLELITFSLNAVKSNELPRKMETVELLQSFLAMVAHCLAFTDPAVCGQNLSQLSLSAILFARRLAHSLNDVLVETRHLQLFIASMLSPWLVFKVTHSILDLYDKSLLAVDGIGYGERLKTLRAMLSFYIKLIPPNDNEVRYVHSKKEKRLYCTEEWNKASVSDVNSNQTSKKRMFQQQSNYEVKSRIIKVDKRNCKGETCFHRACIRNDVTHLKQLLQTPGLDVNAADFAGWTPLHEACNHGNLECVVELLKYKPLCSITSFYTPGNNDNRKVDIYKTNNDGISPLHDAVMNDHIDVARVLIQHGGKHLIDMKTIAGKTSLDLAVSDEMKQLLQKKIPITVLNESCTINGVLDTSCHESIIVRKLVCFHVIKEKYEELEKQGNILSSSQCANYVLLVQHLIVSYLKHYKITELASQIQTNELHSDLLANMVNKGVFPDTLYSDIDALKEMKKAVCDFEKHLKILTKDTSTQPLYSLSVLHVMADCFNSD